ncbi:hypothetical protein EVAR_94466_1 [Eumeta japonica]|uniref:Uncharacterized protein n=1 Tax=Eumeta variegata TaxID=151549 RepID=A0A4C1SX32_EUMVA|nr:hypothetical protein EVAR_94466_1 [Eumeta japonica]
MPGVKSIAFGNFNAHIGRDDNQGVAEFSDLCRFRRLEAKSSGFWSLSRCARLGLTGNALIKEEIAPAPSIRCYTRATGNAYAVI